MANQIRIFNTKEQFRNIGIQDFSINPYLYHNGKDWVIDNSGNNTFKYKNGTPTIVDGIRGKAVKLNGSSLFWERVGMPASEQYMYSFWVKPSASDLATSAQWRILATNRGFGHNNLGMHLAIYNSTSAIGQLNMRVYGSSGGSLDVYTDANGSGKKKFLFQADQWYHAAIIYDHNASYKVRVYVNGELVIYNATSLTVTNGWVNSFTVGDMLTASGGGQYPFAGSFDDIIVAYGENVWTEAQLQDYYNRVINGQFLDYEQDSGMLQVGKNIEGNYYNAPITWESETIDLGEEKFVDYGLLQASGTTETGAAMTFFTRTSQNGTTWTSWAQVPSNGKIASPNYRYLQIRVVFYSNGTVTPILDSITLLEEQNPIIPSIVIGNNDPLYLYRDLETGLDSLGVLKNAYDIIIEEEINGEDKLSFKLPITDRKRKEIGEEPVEMVAMISDRYYVVKEVIDKRDDSGNLYTEFICEARWTELREWYVGEIEVVEVDASYALETIFNNVVYEAGDPQCDWKLGNVEITGKRRTLRSEWADILTLLHNVQNTWGGELLYDTKDKVVHLVNQIGKNSGIRFYYNKNLKNIERRIDTYNLFTRIYPSGKGGLDITTVNDGVPYLEDKTWVNRLNLRKKIIPYRWKDERYTIASNLKEDAQAMLDEMSKPNIAYTTSVHDLSMLTGHEHEAFQLGDTVTIIDEDLFGTEIVNRVVRRKQDVRKPENTTVELSKPLKTLSDIRSRAIDDQIESLIESDPLSQNDIQQMTVFNHLLNSRADDGFSSWVHEANGTQFELANAGFSGAWSFKVMPDFNKQASLTQTVEGVSHRSTYTISAAVATEGKITRGDDPNAFVGIKVLVYYEGETEPEVHYLAIPDITTVDNEEEYDFEVYE